MFGPVQPTQYDLAFSLFGIPVRVTPWFWLTGVLMGYGLLQDRDQGLVLLLIWLGVTFVSILVHELGHALTAALFGYPPRIMLYHFGGVAMFDPDRGYSTAKAILILAAGPAFGFALGVAAVVTNIFLPADTSYLVDFTIAQLIWVNIAWTLVNLLPVFPLDGGQICREVCLAASPYRGIFVALWISIIVGGLVAAGFLFIQEMYPALLFGVLAIQSYQELQHRRAW
jgi:stage IV sporulation protein FB